jgi:hypothetical protein
VHIEQAATLPIPVEYPIDVTMLNYLSNSEHEYDDIFGVVPIRWYADEKTFQQYGLSERDISQYSTLVSSNYIATLVAQASLGDMDVLVHIVTLRYDLERKSVNIIECEFIQLDSESSENDEYIELGDKVFINCTSIYQDSIN